MKLSRWIGLVLLIYMHLVSQAEVLIGHVVGVSDGDTITVIDNNKQRHVIRLMGIDAPEKAQAFGQSSKESLSELVFTKRCLSLGSKKIAMGEQLGKCV